MSSRNTQSAVRRLSPAGTLLAGFVPACAALLLLLLTVPAPAWAQTTEATFSIGALLGDDIDVDDIVDEVENGFDNSPVYGGRVGWYGYPFGVEGSVMYSPSGITTIPVGSTATDVDIMYVEGNVLLTIIPGPVSPFVTGGVGLHRFNFTFAGADFAENSFGWNFGGGVKANIGPVVVRGDIRDHVTRFDANDIPALIGVENTFHNWELSVGVGVAF